MHRAGSLPFHKDYMNEAPACALYFLGCSPKCGCCVPPPKSSALESMFVKNQGTFGDGAPIAVSIDRNEDDGGAELIQEYHDLVDP